MEVNFDLFLFLYLIRRLPSSVDRALILNYFMSINFTSKIYLILPTEFIFCREKCVPKNVLCLLSLTVTCKDYFGFAIIGNGLTRMIKV